MNTPLTVIITTYNQKDSFPRAVESVLSQKTDFDFKIYVTDDASSDGTQEVLKQWKEKYPDKIELFLAEQNRGACRNFNFIFQQVKTDFIAFLEADDYWCDENKLQMQMDILRKHKNCILCSHDTLINDTLNNTKRNMCSGMVKNDKDVICNYKKPMPFVHFSSYMFRNIIDFKELPPEKTMDVIVYNTLLLNGDMYFINKVMSVYNYNGGGIWSSQSYSEEFLLDGAYTNTKLMNYKMSCNLFLYCPFPKVTKLFGKGFDKLLKKIMGEKNYVEFTYKRLKGKM